MEDQRTARASRHEILQSNHALRRRGSGRGGVHTFWALALAVVLAAPLAAQQTPPAQREATPQPAAATTPVPTGRILDGIVSEADPEQTYSVYLPSAYRADRTWPLLLVLDARAQGHRAAELFAPGAEAQGFIVLASDLSRSDDDPAPNLRAVAAMLQDARRRLAVDPARLYLAGLSGTARFVWALAIRGDEALPGLGSVTGVVSCSGGLPGPDESFRQPTFAVFGTTGVWDFNFPDMVEQDEVAAARSVPHRLTTFDGGHRWPPPEQAAEALEWLRLQGMKRGKEPRDPAWIDGVWQRRLDEARSLDNGSDPVAALDRYRNLLADLPEHAGSDEVKARVEKLSADPEVQRRQQLLAEVLEQERAFHGEIAQAARTLRTGETPDSASLLAELGVTALQDRAAQAIDVEQRDGARRRLEMIQVQTGFYLPRELLAEGRYAGAAAALEIALAIKPASPDLWYDLACARARLGRVPDAIAALRRAVAMGFHDRELLATDADLAALREDPGFESVVQSLPSS